MSVDFAFPHGGAGGVDDLEEPEPSGGEVAACVDEGLAAECDLGLSGGEFDFGEVADFDALVAFGEGLFGDIQGFGIDVDFAKGKRVVPVAPLDLGDDGLGEGAQLKLGSTCVEAALAQSGEVDVRSPSREGEPE